MKKILFILTIALLSQNSFAQFNRTIRKDVAYIYDFLQLADSAGIYTVGKDTLKGIKCIDLNCDSAYIYINSDSIKIGGVASSVSGSTSSGTNNEIQLTDNAGGFTSDLGFYYDNDTLYLDSIMLYTDEFGGVNFNTKNASQSYAGLRIDNNSISLILPSDNNSFKGNNISSNTNTYRNSLHYMINTKNISSIYGESFFSLLDTAKLGPLYEFGIWNPYSEKLFTVDSTGNTYNKGNLLVEDTLNASHYTDGSNTYTLSQLAAGGGTTPDSTWSSIVVEDSANIKTAFSEPYQITYAASMTFNGNNGMNQYTTLTGNVTSLTFSNLKEGGTYTFKIIQDAGGTNTLDETGLDYKSNESADFSTTGDDINLMVIYVDEIGNTLYSISTYTP